MARNRLPRPLGIAAAVVGGMLALVALVVGVTFTVARTSWGAERMRRLAIPRVNAAIAGNLEVKHFRFLGDRLVLQGVSLKDPQGDTVARATRIEVAFSPWQLLRRRLYLRAVAIDEPALLLRQDRDGDSNLARALAPRNGARRPTGVASERDKAATTSSPVAIELNALTVRSATLDLSDARLTTATALRHVRLDGVDAQGSGRYGGSDGTMALHLKVDGQVSAPLRGPLSLQLDAQGQRAAAPPADARSQPAGLNIDGD
ncbi:MAG: AsmA family protein, partial [Polyangia bacterium]